MSELEFEVVKHVTLPTLKQETGVPLFLRIEDKIYRAKELTATRQRKNPDGSPAQQMAPPELVMVYNYEDKHNYTMIANSVFAENLRDMYADDGYVGKSFKVTRNQLAGSGSRKYATYDITEIRPKASAPTPITQASKHEEPAKSAPAKTATAGKR